MLRGAAEVDPALINDGRRLFHAFAARTSTVARSLARVWNGVLIVELLLGVLAAWYFWHTTGWQSRWTLSVIAVFAVLICLIALVVRLLGAAARLPQTIDAVAGDVERTLAEACEEYAAVLNLTGWRSWLRTLFAAGKLARNVHKSVRERQGDVRGLYGVILMANPAFWFGQVFLGVACVAVPVGVVVIAVVRSLQ